MLKFIKLLGGIGLLPLCWAVSVTVYTLYGSLNSGYSVTEGIEAWALPLGFFLWILLFFALPRPFRTYVLGHELTHALWALVMGARVGKMKVGKDGGHVELSKTNFIISLSPYFFPFYTFIIISAYYIANMWVNVEPYRAWWLGLVGFTWSFHLTFTIVMLSTKSQPDIKQHGRIFSFTLIYLINVLTMGLWMVLVGSPDFRSFGIFLYVETQDAYIATFDYLAAAWKLLPINQG